MPRHRIAVYIDFEGTADEAIEKAWEIARQSEKEDDRVHGAVASEDPRLLHPAEYLK